MNRTKIAESLGLRAGLRYAKTGLPTRNPFTAAGREDLAAAWRRGYFAVTSGGSR